LVGAVVDAAVYAWFLSLKGGKVNQLDFTTGLLDATGETSAAVDITPEGSGQRQEEPRPVPTVDHWAEWLKTREQRRKVKRRR